METSSKAISKMTKPSNETVLQTLQEETRSIRKAQLCYMRKMQLSLGLPWL
jgi:hypothetical protein